MAYLDVSQNSKKCKDIYFFTPPVDAARAHETQIVKAMPLFTCPTKTDVALVFRIIHVYNLCVILTQTHNVAYLLLFFFVRACTLMFAKHSWPKNCRPQSTHSIISKRNSSYMSVQICANLHNGTSYYNKNRKNTYPSRRINS